MDYFSTSRRHADDTVTHIRVGVTAAAMREVEQLVSDPRVIVERCVWRFISTKYEANAVVGESVEFTLDAEEIMELFADLRRIDMQEMQSGTPQRNA